MQKLRWAALAVIGAGGGLLASERTAQAQGTTMYCCTQGVSQWGPDKIIQTCCFPTGCKVTSAGCVQVE